MCQFNHGCLIGGHLFLPFWNTADDAGLKASIEVWSVPSDHGGHIQHLSTFEVITFDYMAPRERYFHLIPTQESPSSPNAHRGFYPTQAILTVWLSHAGLRLLVPISTFLPEGDIYGPYELRRGPPIVRWEEWGPKRAYIVSPLPTRAEYYAVSGLRIIYADMIADFNELDMMEDIYGFAPRPGPRGGRGRVDDSYVTEGLLGEPGKSIPALGGRPSYRVVPFRRKGTSLYFIEEDDGPKVCPVALLLTVQS